MVRIIATENVSLDGVMESPEEWAFKYQTDDFHAAMSENMGSPGTMLFGRITFDQFAAFWPTSDIEPFASHMRNATKYVVSNTLQHAEWGAGNRVPIIQGDVAGQISRLKQESPVDISVLGSGGLVRSLLRKNLLDELVLCVYLVVLGCGKRLFDEASTRELTLIDSRSFSGGIVILTYRSDNGELEVTPASHADSDQGGKE